MDNNKLMGLGSFLIGLISLIVLFFSGVITSWFVYGAVLVASLLCFSNDKVFNYFSVMIALFGSILFFHERLDAVFTPNSFYFVLLLVLFIVVNASRLVWFKKSGD